MTNYFMFVSENLIVYMKKFLSGYVIDKYELLVWVITS
jgi:hypothetical protein